MKLSESREEFLNFIMGKLSFGTVASYGKSLNRFINKTGDKAVQELTLRDFSQYKMQLARDGRKSSYIAGELSALCNYLKFLDKQFRLRPLDILDVKDLRPVVRAGDPDPLDAFDYDLLLDNALTIEDRAIIVLLFNAGLRISELLGLKKEDILERELPENSESIRSVWIRVSGKGGKVRTIPLNSEAVEALVRYMRFLDIKYVKGYVKLFPYSYSNAWRKIKAVGKAAGVRVHPHMLRHSFATALLRKKENIVTIAKIMGHESLDTTKKYIKIIDTDMVDAVNKLVPAAKNNEVK